MKISLLFFLFIATQIHAQYNFDSCIEFWKLTDKLRKGIAPSDAEWEALRQTEGYKRKGIGVNRWKEFTGKITLAFTPGKEEELAAKLKTDISFKPILEYVRLEDQLKDYMKNMQSLHMIDSALVRVQRNLPAAYQQCFKAPVIYFLFYDYDGSATHQQVIVDLLISYHIDRLYGGVFTAHELYHYVSASCRIKHKHFKRNPKKEHDGVFMAIHAISEEATADLIDKETIVFNDHSLYLHKDTFATFQRLQAGSIIQRINEGLEKLAGKEKGPVTDVSYWMELIPWAAHIPATYISQVIRRNGLEKQLVESAENAFKVFYLYNESASIDASKPPLFSKKAIKFLKLMEKRYLR